MVSKKTDYSSDVPEMESGSRTGNGQGRSKMGTQGECVLSVEERKDLSDKR